MRPPPAPQADDSIDAVLLSEADLSDDDEAWDISVAFETPPPKSLDPTLPGTPMARAAATGRPLLAAGTIVADRFRLERRVGSGGMGEVWAATDVTLGTTVAVKALLPRSLGAPEIVARFEREALLLGRICSDHAPKLIAYTIDRVYGPALVTELVQGASLASVLKAPMPIERAVDLGIDLASGLSDLHAARVIHRDLKPANVILRPLSDGKTRAVIIDFGVSHLVHVPEEQMEAAEITSCDVVLGTIEYMAPEQIVRCQDVGPTADLYALGALLFRAVACTRVFGAGLDKMDLIRAKLTLDAPPLPTLRHDAIARGLAGIIARALERNPEARYQSAAELRADLVELRRTVTGSVPPISRQCSEIPQFLPQNPGQVARDVD